MGMGRTASQVVRPVTKSAANPTASNAATIMTLDEGNLNKKKTGVAKNTSKR